MDEFETFQHTIPGCGVVLCCQMPGEISIEKLISNTSRTMFIPAEINGYPVTEIDREAFRDSNIKEIVFPDSLKHICWRAFDGCKDLEKFNMPKKLNFIGSMAFANCESLISIDIPGDVKFAAQSFFGCTNLKKVRIGEGTNNLLPGVFNHCGIEQIFLPNSLTKIGFEALDDVPKSMVVHCSKDSFAEKWAKEHKYKVVLGRTLLEEFLNSSGQQPKLSTNIDEVER